MTIELLEISDKLLALLINTQVRPPKGLLRFILECRGTNHYRLTDLGGVVTHQAIHVGAFFAQFVVPRCVCRRPQH